jgi:hypothetical protein
VWHSACTFYASQGKTSKRGMVFVEFNTRNRKIISARFFC